MLRSRAGFVLSLVGCLAVWGCSQDNAGNPGANDTAAKTGKLQEEVKHLASARDTLKQDLKNAKADAERLEAENARLRDAAKQRDELIHVVATRTAERDNATQQLDQIKKGVRALLEVIEPAPASPTSAPPHNHGETKPNS